MIQRQFGGWATRQTEQINTWMEQDSKYWEGRAKELFAPGEDDGKVCASLESRLDLMFEIQQASQDLYPGRYFRSMVDWEQLAGEWMTAPIEDDIDRISREAHAKYYSEWKYAQEAKEQEELTCK